MSLASFVKERREGLGLSLNNLARRSGCTKSHIHGIENDRATNPSTLMICGLAAGLQISAVELFRIAAELSSEPSGTPTPDPGPPLSDALPECLFRFCPTLDKCKADGCTDRRPKVYESKTGDD